ncbi:MAG: hypothetical protein M3Y81_15760 [Chloroflexota bacterium]|nr:hypothetical protein [Chloroflexota bacterium]
MAMGLYFVLLRPALLPEDILYLGTSSSLLQTAVPLLPTWLNKVFWVMGAYIFTSGFLTLYLALTSFRSRAKGIFPVMTLAGITSIGWMTMVNFFIDSDFKWVLLVLALLWGSALALFGLESRISRIRKEK